MAQPVASRRLSLAADLALLFSTLVWGSTFVVIKDTLRQVAPFGLLANRFALAGLLLLLVFRAPIAQASRAHWGASLLVGLSLFAGYAFQTVGLQGTTPAKSAFITGLSVVTVPFLAWLLQRQKPRFSALVAVTLAAAGLGLLTLRDDLTIAPGDLISLGCALAFGFQIVLVARFAPSVHPGMLTTIQILVVALVSALVQLWLTPADLVITPAAWPGIAYLALAATALTFLIQSQAQRYTTATRAALIFTLEPVFGYVFAFFLAGEVLSGRALLGCTLILAGMVINYHSCELKQ